MKQYTLVVTQEFHDNGSLLCETFRLKNGKLHNTSGPAYRFWYKNGQLCYEGFWIEDKMHNTSGPAVRTWLETGELASEQFYIDGNRLITDIT